MTKILGFAAGIAALAGMTFTPAAANVVTLGDAAQIECNDDDDATVGCLGVVGGTVEDDGMMGSLDNTAPFTADLYDLDNNSEATQAAALNALVGTSFSGTDGVRTETGGQEMFSFTTLAAWVVIKLGAGVAFIQNTTGGALDIDFSAIEGQGGGISNYTEFGRAKIIPLPGSLWLLIAGLAGLGVAARQRKKA